MGRADFRAMGKNPNRDPAYLAALADYEALVTTLPEVECRGAANPYTSLNGHMFSCLHPNGALALRLPPGMREDFLAEHGARLFESHGVTQKEYVGVPRALLADTARLAPYFRASRNYVAAMKPQPTTRKRA